MYCRRLKKVCKYGWRDAKEISLKPEVDNSQLAIFVDILRCYLKYNVWSNQYKNAKVYSFSGEEKIRVCLKYQESNTKRDRWIKDFYDNYRFLSKWSSIKYNRSSRLQIKRRTAYKRRYGLGENCFIGYNVSLHRHHFTDSIIETGVNCGFSENVNIDYTGGLVLGNRVWLSEGVKILTHNHDLNYDPEEERKGCEITPLIIHDHAWIGSRAMIMPGVKEIGRGAVISADAFVRVKVPPYAIVMGNPAEIKGYKFTPEEMQQFEVSRYSPEDRIDLEEYVRRYDKFYSKQNQ